MIVRRDMKATTRVLAALALAGAATLSAPAAQATDPRPPLPDTTDAAFNQECLTAHNTYRALHGADPLTLDDTAITHATRRARAASTQDGLSTPPAPAPGSYGENTFWSATHDDDPASCEEAVRLWYEARWTGGYDWNRPGYSPDTGSFTQVVWKTTDVLGCARASGRPEGAESYQSYVVCAYGPAGNIAGRFRENVGAPTA
jgi:hypothetical protein